MGAIATAGTGLVCAASSETTSWVLREEGTMPAADGGAYVVAALTLPPPPPITTTTGAVLREWSWSHCGLSQSTQVTSTASSVSESAHLQRYRCVGLSGWPLGVLSTESFVEFHSCRLKRRERETSHPAVMLTSLRKLSGTEAPPCRG